MSFESSKEIARLGINVIKNSEGLVIDSWDSSIEAFGYMKMRIVARVLIHIVVFIFIPLLHKIFFYQNLIHDCSKFKYLYFIELILLLPILIFTIIDLGYRLIRTKALKIDRFQMTIVPRTTEAER